MNRFAQRAFTLVEMLVVIAIIGILIAVLLPAVQAAREAARRAQCRSNLMQVGLALHNHYQATETLPAGVQDDAGPIRNEPLGKHYGWMTKILPYMEHGNTYNHIDFTTGVYDTANEPVRMLHIRTFICPSVGEVDGLAASHYAGCHHDVEAPIDADNHGVLFLNSAVRYHEISDGRSHTLFVGEKLFEAADNLAFIDPAIAAAPTPPDLGWMSGTRATLRNTGTPINHRLRQKKNPPTEEPPQEPATPQEETAAAAKKLDDLLFVGGFESQHAGGAHFALGDGSVRFLTEHISSKVFQQLAHRADGELLDEKSY